MSEKESQLFEVPMPRITATAPESASEFEEVDRPKTGDTLQDEPTHEEIAKAVANDPEAEFLVVIGEEKFPLAELTLMNWRRYLAVFAPRFEEIMKNLLPLVGVALRSYTIWRHLSTEVREKLRLVAKEGDLTLLQDTIHEMGISDYKYEDVVALRTAAQSGDEVGFLIALASVFLGPAASSLLDVFKSMSFSKLFVELDEELPDLVLASLKSSLVRRGKPIDEDQLLAQIELMDGLDLFEIVHKQYRLYVKRGKIRRFFESMMAMKSPNTTTATPSESTTGIIPS